MPVPDFVLRNVRIVELGPGPGWAGPVDLVVEKGQVLSIGHEMERPLGLEEYDAQGRWAIPGLWDAHVHLSQWTALRGRLDLAGTESPEAALARVREHLAEHPGPLVGCGHRTGLWQTEPTVAALDEVAPDVPVVLISGDAHHGWLNSRALERLGLPPRAGVVAENEWYEAYTRIDAVVAPDLSAGAFRRTLTRAAGSASPASSTSSVARPRPTGSPATHRSGSGSRRTPTGSTRSSTPGCTRATCCPARPTGSRWAR